MRRLNRSAWAIVAAVTFGCGSKTGLFDETGAGGSGAAAGESGQASGGNTGASGAAGRGGSTGRGGSAGVSGAAGISGTAGRGGSAGGEGGSTEQIIDAMCTRFEKFGCGEPTCRQGLKEAVDHYNRWGCGDEWLQEQTCTLRDRDPCIRQFCIEYAGIFQQCILDAGI